MPASRTTCAQTTAARVHDDSGSGTSRNASGSILSGVLRSRMSTALVGLLVSGVVIAGCGDDSQVTFAPPSGSGAGDEGPQHVHGLGVNPRDDALMIATHSGLFRVAAGSDAAERVSDRRQDTMGFTVVGPDSFLGSGHPDLRENLPSLLGLIRSQDAGKNWEPVSLLGRADFHVLRAAGARIYGVNATDGRLYVSADGGRTWAKRTPPAPLLDLAAAPGRPEQVVASSEEGLFGEPRRWPQMASDESRCRGSARLVARRCALPRGRQRSGVPFGRWRWLMARAWNRGRSASGLRP